MGHKSIQEDQRLSYHQTSAEMKRKDLVEKHKQLVTKIEHRILWTLLILTELQKFMILVQEAKNMFILRKMTT